jgi:hypothetical protein
VPTIPRFSVDDASDPDVTDHEDQGASPEEATEPTQEAETEYESESEQPTEPEEMSTDNDGPAPTGAEPTMNGPRDPKEIRVNAPSIFDGERSKLQEWLDDCRLYMALNNKIYTSNDNGSHSFSLT